jgi:hypothetical protein|tara:strand:- start:364 stop:639 length:276 start_codon:yes stop_codon:yes gene_type:complete
MKLIVKLSNSLDKCPTSWQNMIYSLLDQEISGYSNSSAVRHQEIHKVLDKFKATYFDEPDEDDEFDGRVEFESGKYHTLFILAYEKEIDGL